jgi:hypothetical protein
MSTWIGLWSPEAPQYKASARREMGSVVKAGRPSPGCRVSRFGALIAAFSMVFRRYAGR